jgi:hypothetical protein
MFFFLISLKKMKWSTIFEAESLTRINGIPLQVYPILGGPVAPGVGTHLVGKYISLPESEIKGDFTYTQTVTSLDGEGRGQGLGAFDINGVDACGNTIEVAGSFTNKLGNPGQLFSVETIRVLITGARVNDRLCGGMILITPLDGGRRYKGVIKLRKLRH